MQSTLEKNSRIPVWLAVALTPLVWIFSFASVMYVVAIVFFMDELSQRIPFVVNVVGMFVLLGSVPVNLAIYGIVVAPPLKKKRNRGLVVLTLLFGTSAASFYIGFQFIDLLTGVTWYRRLLLISPFPFATMTTFGIFLKMSSKRHNMAAT